MLERSSWTTRRLTYHSDAPTSAAATSARGRRRSPSAASGRRARAAAIGIASITTWPIASATIGAAPSALATIEATTSVATEARTTAIAAGAENTAAWYKLGVRGPLGLVIGLIVGAGGMYLVLRPPWGGGAETSPEPDVVAEVPADAGAGSAKPKRKRPKGRPRAGARPAPDGEEGYADEPEPAGPVLTDADRRLEWRGDAVALPAQRIDMAGGGEARALEDHEINATIAAQAGGVRDCVIKGATGTDLSATITVKLLVDGGGRVAKSRVQAPHYLFTQGLLGCTQRALARMKFPATGAPTVVTLPVNLG